MEAKKSRGDTWGHSGERREGQGAVGGERGGADLSSSLQPALPEEPAAPAPLPANDWLYVMPCEAKSAVICSNIWTLLTATCACT